MGTVFDMEYERNIRNAARVFKVITQWSIFDLTPAEYEVFMLLLAHSLSEGKRNVTTSPTLIANGAVVKKNGSAYLVQRHSGLRYATVQKALLALEKKHQLIKVIRHRKRGYGSVNTFTYEIDVDYIHDVFCQMDIGVTTLEEARQQYEYVPGTL